ncbi:MAG TPA: hypothetical protein VKR06_25580, partial [Ktedonosporobacter sp.]|nr:hypothetical protein [Ktedonosporobacter sp.]
GMHGRGRALKVMCSRVASQVCMSKGRELPTRIQTSKLSDNDSMLRIAAQEAERNALLDVRCQ